MNEEQEIHSPVTLFLAYAQEDESWLRKLESHLSLLRRHDIISTWNDQMILAGSNQIQEIEKQLNMASIILLLVSSDFLASDYCYSVEMQRALERAKRNEAYVIPILLRPVDWRSAPFRDLPSLPQKNKPVTTWSNQDEAFHEIATGIRAAANQIRNAADRHHLPPLNLHTITVVPDQPEITLEEAETAYRQQVVETYKWLNFSGFDSPGLSLANVHLEDVFVRLTLTVEKEGQEPAPSETSSQAGRRKRRQRERKDTVQEPIELGQALSNNLMIVGEPGAGKSTLLHWLAVTFAQRKQRERIGPLAGRDRLPVLIELAYLDDDYIRPESQKFPHWETELLNFIKNRRSGFGDIPPQLLQEALRQQNCLLLFDGLDEVADRSARARIAESLVELARLYPGNRIILGSRPAGVSESKSALRSFQHCQIEPFSSEDVRRFFQFWYRLDHTRTPLGQQAAATELYTQLESLPAIHQLATIPLLCMYLLSTWRKEGALPDHHTDLYQRCCRYLIEEWEMHHHVAFHGSIVKRSWQEPLHLLAHIAYFMHSQGQKIGTVVTRSELLPLVAQHLFLKQWCTSERAAQQEAQKYLDDLGSRSGLLSHQGNEQYRFLHQTIQEYLAAFYIQDQENYIDLFMEHLHEEWWQEVHLFIFGILGSSPKGAEKADALLLTILQLYETPPRRNSPPSNKLYSRLFRSKKQASQQQLEQRISTLLARELDLALRGYDESRRNMRLEMGSVQKLLQHANAFLRDVLSDPTFYYDSYTYYDFDSFHKQETTAEKICRILPCNEEMLTIVLDVLHKEKKDLSNAAKSIIAHLRVENKEIIDRLVHELLYESGEIDYNTGKVDLHMQGYYCIVACLKRLGTGNKEVINALLRHIHPDEEYLVRLFAIQTLGELGGTNQAAIKILDTISRDKGDSLCRTAAQSLGKLGIATEATITVQIDELEDASSPYSRQTAAENLGRLGLHNEAVVSALLHALYDQDSEVLWAATKSLIKLGITNEAVVKALLQYHPSPWEEKQDNVWPLLIHIGTGNEEVVSILLHILPDSDKRVKADIVQGLGQLGVRSEEVINALLSVLHDADKSVCMAAIESLGQLGVYSEELVNMVLPDEEQPEEQPNDYTWDSPVRGRIETWWKRFGYSNEEIVNALFLMLHDQNDERKKQVAKRLFQLETENERVIDVLIRYLQDQDSSIQLVAAMALLKLGLLKEEIRDTLRSLLQVQDQRWSLVMLMLVNFFGEGKEEILRLLQDENEEVRLTVAAELADMTDQEMAYGKEIHQEIIHVLQPVLRDADNENRLNAAFYLIRLGVQNEETINTVLLSTAERESSITPLDAVHLLAKFGIRNDEMISIASSSLQNEDSRIQLSALQALLALDVRNNEMISIALSLLQKEGSGEILWPGVADILVTLGIANKELIDALLNSSLDLFSPEYERSSYANALRHVEFSLEQFTLDDEEAAKSLIKALYKKDRSNQLAAIKYLGKIKVREPELLKQVVIALNDCLDSKEFDVRKKTLQSLRSLLDGRPLPSYHWRPQDQ